MKHESFYTSGSFSAPELGVYAGWVAFAESPLARQVFFNEKKDVALIVSGECFFDPSLRSQLKQKGHELNEATASWIVHLYEDAGEDCFEKLNGLFSGVLVDLRRQRAFLFNDRYSVERIYCHENKDGIYFASEAKALLRILPELRAFDKEGLAQFLAFGCTLESRTLFRGIQLLPGASLWSFENGECRKRKYFSPESWEAQAALSVADFEAKFQETFQRVLPRYFESDSKIGVALTAGLDSRMIMACLPGSSARPVCYTYSGETEDTLDARIAARVSSASRLEHKILRVGSDFFSNFATYADRTVYITDGCFGIWGAHEIYMNQQARKLAPVRLTGNFGSEILRSVSTFKPVELPPRLFSAELERFVSSSIRQLIGFQENPITFAAFREIPWNLFGSLAAGRSQVGFRTPYLDNELVALAYQMPAHLRTSSQPALHLIKNASPTLDKIPTDMGYAGETGGLAALPKRLFSKVTFKLDYIYNEGLPNWLSPLDPMFKRAGFGMGILGLHKHLHYRSWFRHELASYLRGALTNERANTSDLWNADFIQPMAQDHIRGRRNLVQEINAVLTLEAVERLLFRELPRGDMPANPRRENLRQEPVLNR